MTTPTTGRSDDLLYDALVAADVADPARVAKAVHDYLRRHDASVRVDWDRVWRREREEAKAKAATAGAQLPDYHGAIKRCQARSTQAMGRHYSTNQCPRKPTKVRRVREIHGTYRGDGRLAVCTQHARATNPPDRWVHTDHWMDRGKPPTADQVVEPEYQP